MKRDGNSAAHLANIRKLPCCVCGKRPVEAHHLTGGPAAAERGVAMKATDKWAVPLCHADHMDLHTLGSRLEREWFVNRGVECYALADTLWHHKDRPDLMEHFVLKTLVGI